MSFLTPSGQSAQWVEIDLIYDHSASGNLAGVETGLLENGFDYRFVTEGLWATPVNAFSSWPKIRCAFYGSADGWSDNLWVSSMGSGLNWFGTLEIAKPKILADTFEVGSRIAARNPSVTGFLDDNLSKFALKLGSMQTIEKVRFNLSERYFKGGKIRAYRKKS